MSPAKTRDNNPKKPIDWNEVRQRVETAAMAIEQADILKSQDNKKILRNRAAVLAREAKKKNVTEESLDIIEFILDDERYGIEVPFVREVYSLRELVPIPSTPTFIIGITNVRGRILSIIDIKKLFGLPPKGLSELDKVIIVKSGGMELGIHADSVIGIHPVIIHTSQAPLPTLTGTCERYIKGITGEQIAILNTEKLLSDKSIVVHEEVEI
jgi:purine-binding chemotaxis protein CheW